MVLTENEPMTGGGSLPTKMEDLSTMDEIPIKVEVCMYVLQAVEVFSQLQQVMLCIPNLLLG